MFTPKDRELERGWPGRIEGDRVIQLAAQTLQSYFTAGGAREHAAYPLAAVTLRAPVLYPPAVRLFEGDGHRFSFANPASIIGPDEPVSVPQDAEELSFGARVAALIGGEARIAGFTLMSDWRAPDLPPPKDSDFATSLGPLVATPDELEGVPLELVARVDGTERARRSVRVPWNELVAHAARNTSLRPGDLLASPVLASGSVERGDVVELTAEALGTLRAPVAGTSAQSS